MRTLSAAELLSIWEQGWGVTSSERTMALLAPACPESDHEQLWSLSVGERDRRLLALREATFGPQIAAVAECPNCGERLELTMQVPEIYLPAPQPSPAGDHCLQVEEYEIRFRLPAAADLSAIARERDVNSARQALLGRCLTSAHRGSDNVAIDMLPDHVLSAVTARMAEIDPQADVQLALSCPSCGHHWQASFDIAGFFWMELDAWAERLVREVHTLASAYGWREAEIVAMSPQRRQTYLELIGT